MLVPKLKCKTGHTFHGLIIIINCVINVGFDKKSGVYRKKLETLLTFRLIHIVYREYNPDRLNKLSAIIHTTSDLSLPTKYMYVLWYLPINLTSQRNIKLDICLCRCLEFILPRNELWTYAWAGYCLNHFTIMLFRPILPYSDIASPEISRPQLYSVLGGGLYQFWQRKSE